ncbi:hypothetical protein NIES4071_50660 [Calothrix sp. NIES-4071]|nr:hypothetical protein NIES4071_50660 [Calothrix sp. NIES-4071]BAZ59374.1 hypothetical protein NIES4105_50610 [Calothrix sp. NIES-4105]
MSLGNLFFADTLCSQNFQGYIEGGCRTAKIAAAKIIRSNGLK